MQNLKREVSWAPQSAVYKPKMTKTRTPETPGVPTKGKVQQISQKKEQQEQGSNYGDLSRKRAPYP